MPAVSAALSAAPSHRAGRLEFDTLASATSALGDPLRLTLLRLLRHSAYAVSELASMLDVSQPALSHHLKRLYGAELVARQREGNSSYYRRGAACTEVAFAGLIETLDALPLEDAVAQRRQQVLAEREAQSRRFFDEHASELASLTARISTPERYGAALLAQAARFAGAAEAALEIGPGDGEILAALAQRYGAVVALDHSQRMLDHTAAALGNHPNLTLRHEPFEALPAQPTFDLIVAAMVLHHSSDPAGFMAHAARCLRPGGLLLVAELCSHSQSWAQETCGDRWLGFAAAELTHWAQVAGLAHLDAEFLAQRNGFRIQIHSFRRPAGPESNPAGAA
ncbi:MAG: metalloregulator ArsR/SmtB family transcription factor [Pseudomonadota bacterium]